MADDRKRDRKFRHELYPQGEPMVLLAEAAVADLLDYERREGVRLRQRKPDDHAGMCNAVHVIVANLAHVVLFHPHDHDTCVILPMSHARGPRTEPLPPGFGAGLPSIVRSLHAIGLLALTPAEGQRLASTIRPTAGFRFRVLANGVGGSDIGRRIVRDLLRLSRREKDDSRTHFPLPATLEATLFRDQMDRINASLATADLAYLGNDPVDVGDRLLTRYFSLPRGIETPCLDYGGRLFGGWWQPMPKAQRRHIRICGEPVVELDYGQVFPRLAFSLVGELPPEGTDLYAVAELVAEHGNEYRSGAKKGFNALLYGACRWGEAVASILPSNWPASRFRKALTAQHPALTELLRPGSNAGYRLLHRESTILVAVLLACSASGIVALPIHDAVLVPASVAETVMGIMSDCALAVAGVPIPVHLKP